ncbi:unnamed protein product [Staurois parvus]|uniref:Uncharacterized protein n=1 Tax=Staurois parvus TaxID=386267 RepID=A0ABN9CVN4_9NEOB|nr:unnamed protein product [Staurois parvus]
MGPCTASSCCCQVQSVSWVPGLVSRLHGGVEFVIGIIPGGTFKPSPVYGLQLKLLLLRHSAIGLLIVVSPRCCWGDFLT